MSDETNHITLDKARAMPTAELANLTLADIEFLNAEIAAKKESLKADQDWLSGYMNDRFGAIAAGMRLQEGKDAGTIRIQIEGKEIVTTVKKTVEWDQNLLADICNRIRVSGDKPEEYVDITYKVSERKYNAWPDAIKNEFSAARTVKISKPAFDISEKK